MNGIFLSYRRGDASGHAGRLSDHLRRHFGHDQVFMDVDTIEPGVDFVEVIDNAVGSCDALLALIGEEWLTAEDAHGNRRIDNPADYVRVEIAAALERKVPVIPLLVQGAPMPGPHELPPALAKLARLNALEISDLRWDYDVGRLVKTLDRVVAPPTPPTPTPPPVADTLVAEPRTDASPPDGPPTEGPSRRRRPLVPWNRRSVRIGGAVVVALAALVLAVLVFGAGGEPSTSVSASATAEPAVDAAGKPVNYRAANVLDSDPTTAWRVRGDGRGVTLTVDFGERVTLRRVGLLPGYAKIDSADRTDRFLQNRRVTRVRYRFDGGAAIEATFADQPIIQLTEVDVETRRLTVEILETVPGDPRFDFTAISELRVDRS